jgi:hypothetical protein
MKREGRFRTQNKQKAAVALKIAMSHGQYCLLQRSLTYHMTLAQHFPGFRGHNT